MRDHVASALLDWYDAHARVMPWRVGPAERQAGARPDPYHVWLSEVMLQQTTVAAVRDYFRKFVAMWPRVEDLAAAADEDVMAAWAGLGYYARARNLLKCARAVAGAGGAFPQTEAELLALPGIGPYTAAAIAAIAFDQPATVVDGNVERVMARLHDLHDPLPASKPALTALAAQHTPEDRPGDYAQAVMDLGATICTPRSPACGICPLRSACLAVSHGTAADLPKKAPKKATPTRRGHVYVGRRADGAWLVETRPDSGLLGGMLGFPGSDWADTPPLAPPCAGDWRDTGLEARHTFTHFHLHLRVHVAKLPDGANPVTGWFQPPDAFSANALPTVMRKVHALAVTQPEVD